MLQEAYEVRGGVDPRPALAFGGGIGHAGDACGVVTGGALAVGLLVGDHIADLQEQKLRTRQLVLPYYRDFAAAFGDVDCRALTDFDISTEEGFAQFTESTLKEDLCSNLLLFAVERLLPLREQVIAEATK